MFTNDMAVTIVQKMPKTLAELEQVRGMGEARLRDFGKELLGVLELPHKVTTPEPFGCAEDKHTDATD